MLKLYITTWRLAVWWRPLLLLCVDNLCENRLSPQTTETTLQYVTSEGHIDSNKLSKTVFKVLKICQNISIKASSPYGHFPQLCTYWLVFWYNFNIQSDVIGVFTPLLMKNKMVPFPTLESQTLSQTFLTSQSLNEQTVHRTRHSFFTQSFSHRLWNSKTGWNDVCVNRKDRKRKTTSAYLRFFVYRFRILCTASVRLTCAIFHC